MEVEEVHVEENFETPLMKRNDVRVFKFIDKCVLCSYCKEFDKTSRNKFISGCELMCIGNVCSHEANNAYETSHLAFLNIKK